MKTKQGFTLLEILLVLGIIAILAGVVIFAVNPARQLGQARDSERMQMVSEINKAMVQFYIDHAYYPASTTANGAKLTTTVTDICKTKATSSPSGVDCTGMIDLSELVPNYLQAIPSDPQSTSTDSLYAIAINQGRNIYVEAPNTEIGSTTISVGTHP